MTNISPHDFLCSDDLQVLGWPWSEGYDSCKRRAGLSV